MQKLSKTEFIKKMTITKEKDKKDVYKWGTKNKTKALRW